MARASKRLSAKSAQYISAPGYHADGDGLYLVVDRSGARRWAFIYHRHGKRREMGLCRMGLKEAREAAEDARRQLRAGRVIGSIFAITLHLTLQTAAHDHQLAL